MPSGDAAKPGGLFDRLAGVVIRWPLLVIAAWVALAASLFLVFPPLPVEAAKHPQKALPDDAPTQLIAKEMAEAFAPLTAPAPKPEANPAGKGDGKGDRDPLGRSKNDVGRGVHVPTDREMQRSRAILDELRKRAGEQERPRSELDYLRRLLQQY